MSSKLRREYEKEYGHIGKTPSARMDSLLNEIYPPGRPRKFHLRVADEIKRISRIPWLHTGFTFYLVPKATPRPRQTTLKNGRMIFYVKGANDHKQFLKEYLQNEDISLIETPIKFDCKTYLPIPKSMPPVTKICAEFGLVRPVGKPDWDNLAKTYCDMIQDLIIADDKLIVDGRLRKFYSVKPRVEIDLFYMQDHDSEFNRRKNARKVG